MLSSETPYSDSEDDYFVVPERTSENNYNSTQQLLASISKLASEEDNEAEEDLPIRDTDDAVQQVAETAALPSSNTGDVAMEAQAVFKPAATAVHCSNATCGPQHTDTVEPAHFLSMAPAGVTSMRRPAATLPDSDTAGELTEALFAEALASSSLDLLQVNRFLTLAKSLLSTTDMDFNLLADLFSDLWATVVQRHCIPLHCLRLLYLIVSKLVRVCAAPLRRASAGNSGSDRMLFFWRDAMHKLNVLECLLVPSWEIARRGESRRKRGHGGEAADKNREAWLRDSKSGAPVNVTRLCAELSQRSNLIPRSQGRQERWIKRYVGNVAKKEVSEPLSTPLSLNLFDTVLVLLSEHQCVAMLEAIVISRGSSFEKIKSSEASGQTSLFLIRLFLPDIADTNLEMCSFDMNRCLFMWIPGSCIERRVSIRRVVHLADLNLGVVRQFQLAAGSLLAITRAVRLNEVPQGYFRSLNSTKRLASSLRAALGTSPCPGSCTTANYDFNKLVIPDHPYHTDLRCANLLFFCRHFGLSGYSHLKKGDLTTFVIGKARELAASGVSLDIVTGNCKLCKKTPTATYGNAAHAATGTDSFNTAAAGGDNVIHASSAAAQVLQQQP